MVENILPAAAAAWGMFGAGQPGRCRCPEGRRQQQVPVTAGEGSHPALSEWVHQHHLDANVLYAAVLC